MKDSFSVNSNGKEYTVLVDHKWYGLENYYVDSRIVLRRFNLKLNGSCHFVVDDKMVKIIVSGSFTNMKCIAEIEEQNDVEIFKTLPKWLVKLDEWSKKNKETADESKNSEHIRNLILWVVIIIVLISVLLEVRKIL